MDQELFHVINALNASPHRSEIQVFVGMLVIDNVPATLAHHDDTLQHAEDVIMRTATVRRQFLADVLAEAGIISRTNAVKKSSNTIVVNSRFKRGNDVFEARNESNAENFGK